MAKSSERFKICWAISGAFSFSAAHSRTPLVLAFVSCSCSCSGSCCGSSCHHSVHNTQRHQRLLALHCDDGRQATEVHFCGFAWWFVAVWNPPPPSSTITSPLSVLPGHLQLAFWLLVSLFFCLLAFCPFVLAPLHMHIVGFPAESLLFSFNLTLQGGFCEGVTVQWSLFLFVCVREGDILILLSLELRCLNLCNAFQVLFNN